MQGGSEGRSVLGKWYRIVRGEYIYMQIWMVTEFELFESINITTLRMVIERNSLLLIYFHFHLMFEWQICFTEVTDLVRFTINFRKSHHQPHCTSQLTYEGRVLFVSRPNSFRFCSWGWIKSQVYKRKLDTRDEFFAGKLDVAAHVKKCDDQLRRTASELCTRVVKGIKVDGWIFDRIF